jgi:hypothetical protein
MVDRPNPDSRQPDDDDDATRPQQPGEAGTTRFGMEDGGNTDVPATGEGVRE